MNDYFNRRTQAAQTVANETKEALQLVYDTLNHGQQQKLLKDENVKTLFDRYGVEYEY